MTDELNLYEITYQVTDGPGPSLELGAEYGVGTSIENAGERFKPRALELREQIRAKAPELVERAESKGGDGYNAARRLMCQVEASHIEVVTVPGYKISLEKIVE